MSADDTPWVVIVPAFTVMVTSPPLPPLCELEAQPASPRKLLLPPAPPFPPTLCAKIP
jgi:hypothetical protein